MYIFDDTITALSSAAAPAARAIIRLSGPNALTITDTFFQSDAPGMTAVHAPPWSALTGRWTLPDDITVPVKVFVFSAPRSYTAEDMAELHLPGSPPLSQMLLNQLLARGARMAEAGEFTARAFFNGRIDLTQAEAVAQIINARSDDQLCAAARLLDGRLRQDGQKITHQIAELLALIEADIDFSDEEIEFASASEIHNRLSSIIESLNDLLDCAVSWDQLNHLPQVVLAGLANAGKSTLVNALLQADRAIISATAGTTRDLVTAPLKLDRGECLLIDTAGLGEVEDSLAEQTQPLTRQAVRQCDLLIYLLDLSQADFEQDLQMCQQLSGSVQKIVVANKMDICPKQTSRRVKELQQKFNCPVIPISAAQNQNLHTFKRHIEDQLQLNPTSTPTQAIALTSRQRQALLDGQQSLRHAQTMINETNDIQAEFLAIHLREALDHLAAINGKVVPNDILGIIFSKFCIGK